VVEIEVVVEKGVKVGLGWDVGSEWTTCIVYEYTIPRLSSSYSVT
jgi:hypothetical protein